MTSWTTWRLQSRPCWSNCSLSLVQGWGLSPALPFHPLIPPPTPIPNPPHPPVSQKDTTQWVHALHGHIPHLALFLVLPGLACSYLQAQGWGFFCSSSSLLFLLLISAPLLFMCEYDQHVEATSMAKARQSGSRLTSVHWLLSYKHPYSGLIPLVHGMLSLTSFSLYVSSVQNIDGLFYYVQSGPDLVKHCHV